MSAKRFPLAIGRVSGGCAAAFVLTLLAYSFHFNLSAATSLHLFLVILVALRWGLLEAGLVSILSVGCLDYFFTNPLFHFYITDSHDWIALLVFEGTALLVSRLSSQLGRHARELERRESQQQALYELSQRILLLGRDRNAEQQLAELIRSSLHIDGVALWSFYGLQVYMDGVANISEEEVRGTYFHDVNEDRSDSPVSVRVLRLGARPIGSLHLYGHALDSSTVNAVAALTSIAIERARSFATEASAEAAKQSEQLRSAILDGLAHAFKSPLTTIRASSSGLLAMNTLSGTEKTLVGLIDRHASQLSELTTHLLLTAKLDSSDLKIKREKIDLEQLLRNAVADAYHELRGHSVELQILSPNTSVHADRKLLRMALLQVLDNAAKYSTPASRLVVGLRDEEAESVIVVQNEGSFIPVADRQKVFERFYRCVDSTKSISGTGIGLSVVKRITEAHKGRTWVDSDPVTGTIFAIALPRMAKERE